MVSRWRPRLWGMAMLLSGLSLVMQLPSGYAQINLPPAPLPPPPVTPPNVPPPPLPPRLVSLTLKPLRVPRGNRVTGTVILDNAAPSGGTNIRLSSSHGAVVVPALVTVPTGAKSESFTITTSREMTPALVKIGAILPDSTVTVTLTVVDPRTRIAVFRPSNGAWILRNEDGSETAVAFGAAEDVPVPHDYDGLARDQIAFYRPLDQTWAIRSDNGSFTAIQWGEAEDRPVPADYLGLGRAQLAVFRPKTGEWLIRGTDGRSLVYRWGEALDIPVPGNYVGDGRAEIAVYRPRTGQWLIRPWEGREIHVVAGGLPGDIPAPAVYDASGYTKVAYYRPAEQAWGVFNLDGSVFLAVTDGEPNDLPVPGDYLGLGYAQIALFRPRTGQWLIRGASTPIQWGVPGDQPVPAVYAHRFGQ